MLILNSSTVGAITPEFEANDIRFYDPDASAATICAPTTIGPIPGEDNLQKIYNFFLSKGASKNIAAAITGNIYQESKGDPLVVQGGGRSNTPEKIGLNPDGSMFSNSPGDKVGKGKAWGLLQWDPGNAALYWQKQAGVKGDITTLNVQLEVAWWQLNNTAPTSKKNVLSRMESASDVNAASNIMADDFFGAGTPHYSERQKAAVRALSYPVDPSIVASSDPSSSTPGSICPGIGTTLTEGGLNEEQAKQFTINYGTNKNNSTKNAMRDSAWRACNGGQAGGGSNCVSFSEFFLNKFTNTKAPDPMGNGHQVVSNLAARGVPTGTEPRVGAIFSIADGGYGHTGVVLGIQGDTIIVGHASCNRGNKGIRGPGDGTQKGTGSAFVLSGPADGSGVNVWWGRGADDIKFAYPEVNTAAIESYLANGG